MRHAKDIREFGLRVAPPRRRQGENNRIKGGRRQQMEKEMLASDESKPPSSSIPWSQAEEAVVQGCPRQNPCLSRKKNVIPIRKVELQSSFRVSARSNAFRRRFFSEASLTNWNDWQWQLRHRICSSKGAAAILQLSRDEEDAIASFGKQLPVAFTPYYASLLDRNNPLHPLRRAVIPVTAEFETSPGEAADPLGEDHDSPVPGLVHRYPDRVLFLVTDYCSSYCRYCTRSRMVGDGRTSHANPAQWERAIAYIEANTKVRDVLLSGGDPLTLSNERLEWLLSRLRKIRHVEFLRIGTKAPVVLPQRITPGLVRMLRRYHPLWLSIHFTHPEELTPETSQACERLADAGIPLGSQTVLLAGINDRVETMTQLFQGLLKIRVKPYYLYQCDPILGSAHFRTPVSKGLEIIKGLRGHTSGYAVPTYVIDAPGGGGKIPLIPDSVLGREGHDLILGNYQGRVFRYPDLDTSFKVEQGFSGPRGEHEGRYYL
jgi:lysine 2,3-aminomutase